MAGSGSRSRDNTELRERPGDRTPREDTMKKNIHPEYVETQVTCTCGNTFTTRSTATSGNIHADVCSQCHPFYTGKQKILDTGGRVARFEGGYREKGDASKELRPGARPRQRAGTGARVISRPLGALARQGPGRGV